MKKLINTKSLSSCKEGNKIHIKKANQGKFTDYCGGKVTGECITRGKASSDPAVRKRATFAANARKWKHEHGGIIKAAGGWLSKEITVSSGEKDAEGNKIKVGTGITNGEAVSQLINEVPSMVASGFSTANAITEQNKKKEEEQKKNEQFQQNTALAETQSSLSADQAAATSRTLKQKQTELANLQNQLTTTDSPGEQQQLQNEINQLQQEIQQLQIKQSQDTQVAQNAQNSAAKALNQTAQYQQNLEEQQKAQKKANLQNAIVGVTQAGVDIANMYIGNKVGIPASKDTQTGNVDSGIANLNKNIIMQDWDKQVKNLGKFESGGIIKPSMKSKLQYINSLR